MNDRTASSHIAAETSRRVDSMMRPSAAIPTPQTLQAWTLLGVAVVSAIAAGVALLAPFTS